MRVEVKKMKNEIAKILRQDPVFKKGRKLMMTIDPEQVKEKQNVVEIPIDKIEPVEPDTGWLKPSHDVYKCLMCDLTVSDWRNRKMNKCPYCGFEMIIVDDIGLYKLGDKHCIMTNPN